jgi:hypothetical protein
VSLTLHWLAERAIAACVLLAAPLGHPEFLEEPAARAHFQNAQQRFESRDYKGAAAALDAAYAIEPAADLLYPWAQAERLDGNCERAVELYRAFLAAEPPAEHARLAEQNITTCDELLARQRREEPRPTAQPGDAVTDAPRKDAPARRPWQRDVAGGILVGTGAAGVVAGTGLLIAALHGASTASEAADVHDYEQRLERARLQRNIAIGAFAVGGALALGGVLRYVVVARRQRVSVAFYVDHSRVGLVLTTRLGAFPRLLPR